MRQRPCGTTRLAADCGGWLSYAAVTPAWFIVERWRKRQLWFAAMTAESTCMCCATSCCRPSGAVWLVDEDLGNRASLFIFLTAIQYTDPWHGVLRRMWRGPRVRCLQRGDESEEVSDGGRGETPVRCVLLRRLRGSQREVRIRWFHSVGWWVLLQQHYVVGSRMAVACSVQGCLFSCPSFIGLDCVLRRLQE